MQYTYFFIKKIKEAIENNLMFLWLNMVIFSLGLLSMFILEKFFGYAPCFLCIVQRYIAAGAVIFAFIGALLTMKYAKDLIAKIFITILFLASLGMLGVAMYQVLVEHGFLQLSSSCYSADFLVTDSKLVLDMMESGNIRPSCDRPQYLFGISVADWTLLCMCVLNLGYIARWRIKK